MKIVILADSISSQQSGIHYYGMQFVKKLISTRPQHDVSLICTKEITDLKIEQHIIPVKSLPMHLRWRQLFVIPKVVKKIQPDLVIELAHFGPFGLPDSIKKVTVIHDLTPILFPKYHSTLSYVMHKLLLPGILKNADTILTNSVATKQDIVETYMIEEEKIYPIYPEVCLDNEGENSREQEEYLLALGTIEPRKNYETLLKAFTLIAESNNNIQLHIIGKDGWKNESFYELYNNHKFKERIKLKGYMTRQDLIQQLVSCKIFVFPSHYEGFGIPILEAMYFGKAIVLSDIPTSKELVADAAVYFNTLDHQELSNTIVNLLNSDVELKSLEQKAEQRYKDVQHESDKQFSNWSRKYLS